jgi:ethanolamine utilization protein EutA (predicted chaperonin)
VHSMAKISYYRQLNSSNTLKATSSKINDHAIKIRNKLNIRTDNIKIPIGRNNIEMIMNLLIQNKSTKSKVPKTNIAKKKITWGMKIRSRTK